MQNLDHKHIIINAKIKNPPTDPKVMEDWFRRLVDAVDMKILIEPQVIYCETPGNEGMTGICCIETSHSSFHIWDHCDEPFMKFDLYSCKEFDENTVIDFIKEFDAKEIEYIIVDRNDGVVAGMPVKIYL